MKPLHLLFVYNADGGLFGTVTDFVHKLVSPNTYNCHLCALTYGNFLMKQEWKTFLTQLPAEKMFLHKDEFEQQYHSSAALPAIFYLEENTPLPLLSAAEINACPDLEKLQMLLQQKIRALQKTVA
jgi:hypothetical protein